jgi:hypothetical protein
LSPQKPENVGQVQSKARESTVTALRYLWSIKWSLAGVAAAVALSFVSLGLLGYVLYYAAYPVVGFVFPPLTAWRPDSVWPLIVGAGVVWSLSFLPAGILNHTLASRGVPSGQRRLAYVGILWVGAVVAWLFMIATNLPSLRH